MEDNTKNIIDKRIKLGQKFIDEKLNEEPVLESARVGFINGAYEVYVHTDDAGYIPHVHIRDKATRGKEFETCVALNSNEYFLHGKYDDKMSGDMIKLFSDFMKSKPLSKRYSTNYELAVDMWNLNNSDTQVDVDYDDDGEMIIPDYKHIKSNK